MSTLKITVKKVRSARCLTRESVIVGALCCVINGHTTTTNHWSCIYTFVYMYIVGCCYNTQESMQFFCLHTLLSVTMITVNMLKNLQLNIYAITEPGQMIRKLQQPRIVFQYTLTFTTTFRHYLLLFHDNNIQPPFKWEFLYNRTVYKFSPAWYTSIWRAWAFYTYAMNLAVF